MDSIRPSRNEPLPTGATTCSGACLHGKSPSALASSAAGAAAAAAVAAGSPGVLPVPKAREACVVAGVGDRSHNDDDDKRPCERWFC